MGKIEFILNSIELYVLTLAEIASLIWISWYIDNASIVVRLKEEFDLFPNLSSFTYVS